MLPNSWNSSNLLYSRFQAGEETLAKSIFDSNAHLKVLDPTFDIYPITEFVELIDKDQSKEDYVGQSMFFLRKIATPDGRTIGYVQVEINTPQKGNCWLPMLALDPKVQSRGYGGETVESVLSQLRQIPGLSTIGLNVYAENSKAFSFWIKCGFREIIGFDRESHNKRDYTCITLKRQIGT